MIKAIIFDCFGVLTADSWHEFRQSLPPEQQPHASELNQRFCRGEITKAEFLESVADLTGKTESFVHDLIDNEQDKNVALLEYIKELKKDHKIGLLSNVASGWIRDAFLSADETELFDTMIFSFEVGLTKPDTRIFLLAAQRMGVQPDECLMVDDIDRYCEAARTAGLQAICYKNLQQFKRDTVGIL